MIKEIILFISLNIYVIYMYDLERDHLSSEVCVVVVVVLCVWEGGGVGWGEGRRGSKEIRFCLC